MMFSERETERASSAIADVMCWFAGFRAGNADATLPPGLDDLRELNCRLKDLLSSYKRSWVTSLKAADKAMERHGFAPGDDGRDQVRDVLQELDK